MRFVSLRWTRRSLRGGIVPALACAVLVAVGALSSCATAPEGIRDDELFSLIPDDVTVAGKAEVRDNMELAVRFVSLNGSSMDLSGMEVLLKRVDSLYFGLDNSDQDKPQWFGLITGNFPRIMTMSTLSAEEGWIKKYKPLPFWESPANGLRITVPRTGIILFTNGDIGRAAAAADNMNMPVSPEAAEDISTSDVGLYLSDPAALMLADFPLNAETFPLQSTWFSLRKNASSAGAADFEVFGTFMLDTKENARKMAMFSRIIVVGWLTQNKLADLDEIRDSLSIEADGRYVRLSGIFLDQEGLLALASVMMPDSVADEQ